MQDAKVGTRPVWLAVAGVLSLACATAAQASPPDAAAAAAAPADKLRRRPWVVSGGHPLMVVDPPDGAFVLARRGYLGVQLLQMTPELREHFGAPKDAGVLVAKVTPDGPGAKAGLRVGDVLTAIDGEKVADDSDVRRRIRSKKDNDTAALEVVRNRARQNLKAQIALKETTELDLGDVMGNGVQAFRLDGSGINDAVDKAIRSLERPEVRERLLRRREADEKIQERTRALEQRIERLEKQLQGKK
jgi:membrane-associated protease RseP (regulator of RpoE activity)